MRARYGFGMIYSTMSLSHRARPAAQLSSIAQISHVTSEHLTEELVEGRSLPVHVDNVAGLRMSIKQK
jgi:hypothetical protein